MEKGGELTARSFLPPHEFELKKISHESPPDSIHYDRRQIVDVI